MFVRSSGQILLPWYLMNGFGLNNFHKTDMVYSLAATDDLIRFWRSKIRGQGHSRPKYVVVKASTSTLGHRSPSSSLEELFCYESVVEWHSTHKNLRQLSPKFCTRTGVGRTLSTMVTVTFKFRSTNSSPDKAVGLVLSVCLYNNFLKLIFAILVQFHLHPIWLKFKGQDISQELTVAGGKCR